MRDDRKADCAACETAPNGPEHQTIRGDEVKDDATMPIGPQRGWFDHAVADDDRRLMSAIERLQAVGFTVCRTAISGDRRPDLDTMGVERPGFISYYCSLHKCL
jgi:hypothetical protein